jgi:hypothetical protein
MCWQDGYISLRLGLWACQLGGHFAIGAFRLWLATEALVGMKEWL